MTIKPLPPGCDQFMLRRPRGREQKLTEELIMECRTGFAYRGLVGPKLLCFETLVSTAYTDLLSYYSSGGSCARFMPCIDLIVRYFLSYCEPEDIERMGRIADTMGRDTELFRLSAQALRAARREQEAGGQDRLLYSDFGAFGIRQLGYVTKLLDVYDAIMSAIEQERLVQTM